MSEQDPEQELSSEQMTDDDILRFTQGTRKALIQEMTREGYPNDPKEQRLLLTALADMDRTALGNKRISADESIAENDRAVAQTIARLKSELGGRDPFRKDDDAIEGTAREVPDPQLPDAQTVPGETETGLEDLNYDDFIEKMEGTEQAADEQKQ